MPCDGLRSNRVGLLELALSVVNSIVRTIQIRNSVHIRASTTPSAHVDCAYACHQLGSLILQTTRVSPRLSTKLLVQLMATEKPMCN